MPDDQDRTLDYKAYARQGQGGSAATPAPARTVAVDARATFRKLPPVTRLVCVHPAGDLLGRLFDLRAVPALLGREEGSDFLVPDPSVSRVHARFDPRPDGTYRLTDLGSTNGTHVNGARVEATVVRNGDRIEFGNTVFLYLTGERG